MTNTLILLVTADDHLYRYWQAAAVPDQALRAGLDWMPTSGCCVLIDAAYPMLPPLHDTWWAEKSAVSQIVLANTIPNDKEAFAALQAGCRGYCHAAAPVETLRQVFDAVQAGGVWAGQSLMQRLLQIVNQLSSDKLLAQDLLSALSAREREVVMLVAKGAINRVIAHELGVSERTVKAHLTSVFEKLKVSDRVQLALLVNGVSCPVSNDR